jgi:hypothetical protein
MLHRQRRHTQLQAVETIRQRPLCVGTRLEQEAVAGGVQARDQ